MTFRMTHTIGATAFVLSAIAVPAILAQSETFEARATIRTETSAMASAPVIVVIDRKMPREETSKYLTAFKTGGAEALRKALVGVKPTGTVQLGAGKPVPTRMTLERVTDKGRLITIVTDTPLIFLGGGRVDAPARAGYDFGVIDLEVDASGRGSGTLSPAAKVTVKNDVFVVEDYSGALVTLNSVAKK